jgi:predicted nucleic acid-binding protein
MATLAELQEGVNSGSDPDGQSSLLQDFLADVEVLPIDAEVCAAFGRERARLRREGQLVADMELLVAATALRHGLIVLTERRELAGRFPDLATRSTRDALAPRD